MYGTPHYRITVPVPSDASGDGKDLALSLGLSDGRRIGRARYRFRSVKGDAGETFGSGQLSGLKGAEQLQSSDATGQMQSNVNEHVESFCYCLPCSGFWVKLQS